MNKSILAQASVGHLVWAAQNLFFGDETRRVFRGMTGHPEFGTVRIDGAMVPCYDEVGKVLIAPHVFWAVGCYWEGQDTTKQGHLNEVADMLCYHNSRIGFEAWPSQSVEDLELWFAKIEKFYSKSLPMYTLKAGA